MSDTEPDPAPPPNPADPIPEPTRKSGAGRILRRALTACFIVIFATGIAGGALFNWALGVYSKPGPLTDSVEVIIAPGSGLKKIANQLAAEGVIAHPMVFIALLRYAGHHTRLTAGEYEFPPGIAQVDVARMLIDNDVIQRLVTVPEGLTVVEIFDLVAAVDLLSGDLPVPPPEGSLLPESYTFQRGDRRADLIARMQDAMSRTLAEQWADRDPNLPLATPLEAVTLASIVEKETGVAAERARIAGVFINRLRKGMRLQSDPTVSYALTGGKAPLGRSLTRQDWKLDHPYNTYQIIGLPPGPIANPGRTALQAALHPVQSNELYFVADGSGGHAFAATLQQHNRNVTAWRKIRDSAAGSGN